MPLTPEQFEYFSEQYPEIKDMLYIHDRYGQGLGEASLVQRLKKYADDQQPVEIHAGVSTGIFGSIDAVNGDMVSILGAGDELVHIPISAISLVRLFNPTIIMHINKQEQAKAAEIAGVSDSNILEFPGNDQR